MLRVHVSSAATQTDAQLDWRRRRRDLATGQPQEEGHMQSAGSLLFTNFKAEGSQPINTQDKGINVQVYTLYLTQEESKGQRVCPESPKNSPVSIKVRSHARRRIVASQEREIKLRSINRSIYLRVSRVPQHNFNVGNLCDQQRCAIKLMN